MARIFSLTTKTTTFVIGCFVLVGVTKGENQYSITNLGSFGGTTVAYGLNDHGEVVGASMLPNGDTHAFLWTASAGLFDIGTIPGDSTGVAMSINNSEQVVGYSQPTGDNPITHAFLWQTATGIRDIGATSGTSASAFAINDQGQISGQSYTGQFYQFGAGFTYTPTTGITPLTISGVLTYDVRSINNVGQMIVDGPQSENSLYYFPGTSPTEIKGPTGTTAQGLAMNNRDTVVGNLYGPSDADYVHAFVWTPRAGLVDITPSLEENANATGVNDIGQVVGVVRSDLNSPWRPFLYEDGTLYDLTTLLGHNADGWANLFPEAINSNGQIVGVGTFGSEQQAFILNLTTASSISPAPEPTTLSLLALATPLLLKRRQRRCI